MAIATAPSSLIFSLSFSHSNIPRPRVWSWSHGGWVSLTTSRIQRYCLAVFRRRNPKGRRASLADTITALRTYDVSMILMVYIRGTYPTNVKPLLKTHDSRYNIHHCPKWYWTIGKYRIDQLYVYIYIWNNHQLNIHNHSKTKQSWYQSLERFVRKFAET